MVKPAAAAGHICLDIIPEIDHSFTLTPGRLFEVGAPTIATGGTVSNTGIAMHILGVPMTLIGKIGDDIFGHAVLEVLRRYDPKLAAGMLIQAEAVTSYTVVVNIPGQDRIFLHCPGANHTFGAEDIDYAKLAGVALFHLGYPPYMRRLYENSGSELESIFRHVKRLGITTSLDLGMPEPEGPSGRADWKGLFRRCLPHVDVFMPSADELLYVLRPDRFGEGDNLDARILNELAAELLDFGVAVAGIKLGARGLYIRTACRRRIEEMGAAAPGAPELWADRELWFPVYEIAEFAGATGAGDTTIAGFLAALLRDADPVAAGTMANAVGACNVQAPDALSGIHTWDETEALVRNGWTRVPLDLRTPGWRFDPETSVWRGPSDAA